MCLERLGKFRLNHLGFGYKWVIKAGNKYFSPNDGSYIYKRKIWNKAIGKKELALKDRGFHIFNNKWQALKSLWKNINTSLAAIPEELTDRKVILLEVKYRSIVSMGYGDGLMRCDSYQIIVAKEIKIIKEI